MQAVLFCFSSGVELKRISRAALRKLLHSCLFSESALTRMDPNMLSVLGHMRSKPMGKVRRRVQNLRMPLSSSLSSPSSPSCLSFSNRSAIRADLDLSHNESRRLAVDCLLSCGLQEYQEVLEAEAESDFLSGPEKIYILTNAKHEGAGRGWRDHVPAPPSVDVYFQSDIGAASLKDLVREFIRKASRSLAIVMDTFSDAELLCDLLEASRKRNVSVHLLLDHLNLNLFSSMCQDLNIDGRRFPKLLVSSVGGQTYRAKTGVKLTGQLTESFIIADCSEVLTGTYSFSWLSWQVHRSFAVLLTGGAATPFHQEFQRLYASSKPIPSHPAEPRSVLTPGPRQNHRNPSTQQTQANTKSQSQTQAELRIQSQSQVPDHPTRLGQTEGPHGSSDSITDMGAKRTVSVPDSDDSPGLAKSQTYEQEQRNRLKTWSEDKMRDIHYKPTSKPHLNLDASATVGASDVFLLGRRRCDRPTRPPGITVGLTPPGRQGNDALTVNVMTDPVSGDSQVPSSFRSQRVQTGSDHRRPSARIRSLTPWLEMQSSLRAERQVHAERLVTSQHRPQPRVEHPDTDSSSVHTVTNIQSHLLPCLVAMPTRGTYAAKRYVQPDNYQLFHPQRYTTRTRAVVHHRSFTSTYGTGQTTDGQLSSRQFQSNVIMSLSRNNGLTDRLQKGSVLNLNPSKS